MPPSWTRPATEKLDAKPLAPELAEIRKVQVQGRVHRPDGPGKHDALHVNPAGFHLDRRQVAEAVRGRCRPRAAWACPTATTISTPNFAEKKASYEAYVAQMLTMVGWEKPAENAKAIVAFETRLAEASWSRIERRDRDKTYNPMSLAELNAATPGFDWNRYLAATEPAQGRADHRHHQHRLPQVREDLRRDPARHPEGLAGVPHGRRAAPLPVQALRRRQLRSSATRSLPASPSSRRAGSAARRSWTARSARRWARVYVARYFPPEAKVKMDALVADIRTALKARIETPGLDGPRDHAREGPGKAVQVHREDRLPGNWRDYSGLELQDGRPATATSPAPGRSSGAAMWPA